MLGRMTPWGWNTGDGSGWHTYGLLAPFERRWDSGVCLEDPAIVPWMPLSERPEGWALSWGCGQPHVWHCLCEGCEAGTFERAEAPDPEEAAGWWAWAATRLTLAEARGRD